MHEQSIVDSIRALHGMTGRSYRYFVKIKQLRGKSHFTCYDVVALGYDSLILQMQVGDIHI